MSRTTQHVVKEVRNGHHSHAFTEEQIDIVDVAVDTVQSFDTKVAANQFRSFVFVSQFQERTKFSLGMENLESAI
jgi:hypothetical protein